MNSMTNANNAASGLPGSAATVPASVGAPAGQTAAGQGVNYEVAYKELEGKMGGMGQELGEYRNFFQNISPLLEKLDQNPELVQAIVDGKIDKQLAQAVAEGRINITDAAAVSQANQEVRSEVGQKVYDAMTPEKVAKLVEEKAQEIRKDLEEKADLKSFEEKTQKFIETTADFAEYAEDIDKWLDTHDVTDIEIAYWAVKGQKSGARQGSDSAAAAASIARDLVANASGGGVSANATVDGSSLIDKLVAGPSNPIF